MGVTHIIIASIIKVTVRVMQIAVRITITVRLKEMNVNVSHYESMKASLSESLCSLSPSSFDTVHGEETATGNPCLNICAI